MSDDLVKRICQQWVDVGCIDECFWEQWPDCPSGQDRLTPGMVLDRIEQLEAEKDAFRTAARALDLALRAYRKDKEMGEKMIEELGLNISVPDIG